MILNLTPPHPPLRGRSARRLVIEPEDTPARLTMVPVGGLRREARYGIPIETVGFGHAYGLPDPHDGISCIVSLPVALALIPHCSDLLVPYREVRNASVTVIGCRQLAQPV